MRTSRQSQGAEPAEREINYFLGRVSLHARGDQLLPLACKDTFAERSSHNRALPVWRLNHIPCGACMDGSVSEPCQHGPRALLSVSCSAHCAPRFTVLDRPVGKLGSCFERLLDVRTHAAASVQSQVQCRLTIKKPTH